MLMAFESVTRQAKMQIPGLGVWFSIGVLSIVAFFSTVERVAFSVVTPLIKSDLQITDSEIGALGGALSVFYAVAGLPIAWWADRGSRRNIIAIAVGLWSVMTVLCAAANNFWQLFLSRVGVGVGEAGAQAPSGSMLCDLVPLSHRPIAFAVLSFGTVLGLALGTVLCGWLGENWGWRATFVCVGVPGLVVALLVILGLREPKRGKFDARDVSVETPSVGEIVKFLGRCRTYRLFVLLSVASAIVHMGLMQWWPSFFMRVHGVNLSAVGLGLGAALAVGAGAGLIMGGLIAGWAARRDVGLTLAIAAAANVFVIITVAGALIAPAPEAAFALVGLSTFFSNVGLGPFVSAVFSVVKSNMRATAGVILGLVTAAFGAIGPLLMGALSDLFAPAFGEQALRWAMLVPVPLLGFVVYALWAASRSLSSDLEAVGAI